MGDICPNCFKSEVAYLSPRTVYACGSSDYDQRPGTFKKGLYCGELHTKILNRWWRKGPSNNADWERVSAYSSGEYYIHGCWREKHYFLNRECVVEPPEEPIR